MRKKFGSSETPRKIYFHFKLQKVPPKQNSTKDIFKRSTFVDDFVNAKITGCSVENKKHEYFILIVRKDKFYEKIKEYEDFALFHQEMSKAIQNIDMKLSMPYLTGKIVFSSTNKKNVVKRVEKLNRYMEEFFENILTRVGKNVHCEEIINNFFDQKLDENSFIPDAFSFETCGGDFRKNPKISIETFKSNFCYSHIVDIDDLIGKDVELEEEDLISYKEYVKILTISRKTAYLILKNEQNTIFQFNSKRRSGNINLIQSSFELKKTRKRRQNVMNINDDTINDTNNDLINKSSRSSSMNSSITFEEGINDDILIKNELKEYERKLRNQSLDKVQKRKLEKENEIIELEQKLIILKKELNVVNSILSEFTQIELKKKIKKSTDYYLITKNEENLKIIFKKNNMETQNKFYEPISNLNSIYDENNEIKQGNIYKLVYHLTSEINHQNEFDHRFLLTYRSFCSSEELLNLLIHRYNTLPPKIFIDEDEFEEFFKKKLLPIRLRVSQILTYWTSNHFYEFFENEDLKKKLLNFVNEIGQTGMESASIKILNLISKKTKEYLISRQEEESSYILFFKENEIESIINNYSEEDIAKQLILISSKLFQKIQPNEFLNKNWMDEEYKFDRAKNLIKMINRSNLVGNWITSEIIKPNLEDRINSMIKIIKIAKIVKEYHNYNLLVEILSGLGSNPVYRLKKTWDELPENIMNTYNELIELINPKGSYKNLRKELTKYNPPVMPYLGMHLTDLLFIEDGNPDIKENNLINWSKRKLQAEIIRSVQMYQQMSYEKLINDFDDPDLEFLLTELEKKCENMDVI
eukprot:gene1212-11302_t